MGTLAKLTAIGAEMRAVVDRQIDELIASFTDAEMRAAPGDCTPFDNMTDEEVAARIQELNAAETLGDKIARLNFYYDWLDAQREKQAEGIETK